MLMFQPIRRYARFSGRARRLEYWLFHLFVAVVTAIITSFYLRHMKWFNDYPAMEVGLAVPPAIIPSWPLVVLGLFQLFVFLPLLAVSVRRLHDSDKSGWWLLLLLIPAGQLVLLVFYLLDGTHGPNRFGADPKGRAPIRY